MILLQIELLHLKDLFMEIILCSRVSFEMIKSLHESLSERRNLPFWEVIKEFFYVWWEANSRLPINSELICLIFIDLVILLILNNDFLMHLRQMKLNQIFFSDGLHICWVHNYQLFSFVRLCDYLHRSVADHLVLKELQFLLLLKFLQSSWSQLVLLQIRNFHRFNFPQQNWKSQIVILIIFQRGLELTILAAIIFPLYNFLRRKISLLSVTHI